MGKLPSSQHASHLTPCDYAMDDLIARFGITEVVDALSICVTHHTPLNTTDGIVWENLKHHVAVASRFADRLS